MKSFNQFKEDLDRLNARRSAAADNSRKRIQTSTDRVKSHQEFRNKEIEDKNNEDNIVKKVVNKLRED